MYHINVEVLKEIKDSSKEPALKLTKGFNCLKKAMDLAPYERPNAVQSIVSSSPIKLEDLLAVHLT